MIKEDEDDDGEVGKYLNGEMGVNNDMEEEKEEEKDGDKDMDDNWSWR